ncbi:MAG: hypothetical protein S4CHLAM102_06900 [Chlamydiia bacterium]|nr:hypothetical protein [Chlamydiia bacterium]
MNTLRFGLFALFLSALYAVFPQTEPVVNKYHSIRDNVFLNYAVEDGDTLETLGNFFLTPSRYLFGGQTVKKIQPVGKLHDLHFSHDYSKLSTLKTLLSSQVLTLSWLVGGTIKAIGYFSPKTQSHHIALRASLDDFHMISNDHTYKLAGIDLLFSDTHITPQQDKAPTLTKKQKANLEALSEVATLFEVHKLAYFLDRETALGAYVQNSMLDPNDPISIGILQNDSDNVMRLLKQLDPDKYTVQDWSSYSSPKSYLKLYVKKSKSYINIYHYAINEPTATINYLFSHEKTGLHRYAEHKNRLQAKAPHPYNRIFPLKTTTLNGIQVRIPSDLKTFLESTHTDSLPAKKKELPLQIGLVCSLITDL